MIFRSTVIGIAAVCAGASAASAAPVGFDLTISGDATMAVRESYALTNNSVSAFITSITIGITGGSHGFDCVFDLSSGNGASNGTDGDCFNGNLFPTFTISYSDFDPSEQSTWTADIDPNSSPDDWRLVLANGTVDVAFSDGQTLSGVFAPLVSGQITDTTLFSFSMSTIPVPAALPLLAGGIGSFAFFGWRRKRGEAA